MFQRYALSLACLWMLSGSVPIQAATLTLAPSADIRILDFFPSTNFFNNISLSVFTLTGNTQRTLMSFDFSSIPAGQQIVSATLTLTALTNNGNNSGGVNMDVHAVTTPWIENQATWNSASAGNPWTTAGGDFDPFIYASSNANPLNNTPVTWNVTSLVQDWYDGTIPNEGLLLRSFNGNGLTFYSSLPGNPVSFLPSLTIEYTAIPEAGSLMLVGLGIVAVVGVARGRRALPGSR
jgi:hypothetical protein